MTVPSINAIWSRLRSAEGEAFETKTGKPFTYEIEGNTFRPSRTKYNIPRTDFETALAMAPLEGPGDITNTVRGSSYIWAVLHDKRIRQKDW